MANNIVFQDLLTDRINDSIGDQTLNNQGTLLHYDTTLINSRSRKDYEELMELIDQTGNFEADAGSLTDRRWIDVLVSQLPEIHAIILCISSHLSYVYQQILKEETADLSVDLNTMIWSATHRDIWSNPLAQTKDRPPSVNTKSVKVGQRKTNPPWPGEFTTILGEQVQPGKSITGDLPLKYNTEQYVIADGAIHESSTMDNDDLENYNWQMSRSYWFQNDDRKSAIDRLFKWFWGKEPNYADYNKSRDFVTYRFMELINYISTTNFFDGKKTPIKLELFIPLVFTQSGQRLQVQKFQLFKTDDPQQLAELNLIDKLTTSSTPIDQPYVGNKLDRFKYVHPPAECVVPVTLDIKKPGAILTTSYSSFINLLKKGPVICKFNKAAEVSVTDTFGLWLHKQEIKFVRNLGLNALGDGIEAGPDSPRIESTNSLNSYPVYRLTQGIDDFTCNLKNDFIDPGKYPLPAMSTMVCVGMRYLTARGDDQQPPAIIPNIDKTDKTTIPAYVEFLFDTLDMWADGIRGRFWISIDISKTNGLKDKIPWILNPNGHTINVNAPDDTNLNEQISERSSGKLDSRWETGKGTKYLMIDKKENSRLRKIISDNLKCNGYNEKFKDTWRTPVVPTSTTYMTPIPSSTPGGPCDNIDTAIVSFDTINPSFLSDKYAEYPDLVDYLVLFFSSSKNIYVTNYNSGLTSSGDQTINLGDTTNYTIKANLITSNNSISLIINAYLTTNLITPITSMTVAESLMVPVNDFGCTSYTASFPNGFGYESISGFANSITISYS